LTVTAAKSSAYEQLRRVEEETAWSEYLDETKRLKGARYDEVEGWAWSRLQEKLQVIARVRKRAAARAKRKEAA
jgi:predicted Fe-S protein YdhL (DUF1289 family)